MKKIWINKAKSFKEAEEWDRKFWRRAGSHMRFIAAWSTVIDYFRMKGKYVKNASEPRLRRSVQNIERLQS